MRSNLNQSISGIIFLRNSFESELSRNKYYLIALGLSVLYTLHLFPWSFITGTNGFWFDTRSDPTQHITGMWAFVHDQWRFPLLYTKLLNAPEGVSVAFTDSIPLAIIPFKLIYHWLPEGAHYFGAWVIGCYLLQGLVGAYAMTILGDHKLKGAVFGSLFVLMMPSLMIRIPHAALIAQFMLLLSIVWYFKFTLRQITAHSFFKRNLFLLLLASLIHPYFIAMLYPIFLVSLLEAFFKRRISASMLGVYLLCTLLLLFFSFYCVGYITLQGGFPPLDGGFENSSMNLISPLLGTHLANSVFIPSFGLTLDATGGQIDGHNYLGIGLWLMLFYMLLMQRQLVVARIKEHWLMVVLMLGFFVYSLSSAVYFSDKLILHYTIPEAILPITKIFRGSGRFFWPVGYILILLSLMYFLAQRKSRYLIMMIAFLIVQYVDTFHHREYLTEATSRSPYFAYSQADWDVLIKEAKAVYLLPVYGCGANPFDTLFVQYFTSRYGVPFNTGFIARINSHCDEKNRATNLYVDNGNLFIFLKEKYSENDIENIFGLNSKQWCREHSIGIVCQIGANAQRWDKFDNKTFMLLNSNEFTKIN